MRLKNVLSLNTCASTLRRSQCSLSRSTANSSPCIVLQHSGPYAPSFRCMCTGEFGRPPHVYGRLWGDVGICFDWCSGGRRVHTSGLPTRLGRPPPAHTSHNSKSGGNSTYARVKKRQHWTSREVLPPLVIRWYISRLLRPENGGRKTVNAGGHPNLSVRACALDSRNILLPV